MIAQLLTLSYIKLDVEQYAKADRLRVSRSLRKEANPRATLRLKETEALTT